MCEERNLLSRECTNAETAHAESLDRVKQRMGICSAAEYDALKHEADRAKARVDRGRAALMDHIAEHGCGEA